MRQVGGVGLVLAIVVSMLGCGIPTMLSSSTSTALQAVRVASKLLVEKHPAGQVVLVASTDVGQGGTAGRWAIHVWDPTGNMTYHYQVANGQLSSIGGSGLTWPPTQPFIASFSGGTVAPALDSDAASAAAGAAGGNAFEQKTGARVLTMTLVGADGEDLRWMIFYSKPYTEHRASLELDAKSGKLLSVDTDDPSWAP
jgi:hypothetical protein